MALKSSEVLKGNFPASRRYSLSHPGIDFVCPVTASTSRYNGVIVEVKRNPKGVDWGLFIRVKYNNSNVIGAYAHLSRAIVKVDQKVVKGQIIGYTGNTGYTISGGVVCNERKNCGLHLHYSEHTTGKLVWLDPDNQNVVKLTQESEMIDKKYLKDKLFKYKGSPYIYWHIPSLEAFKKYIAPTTVGIKTIPIPNTAKLKTLASQVKNLQKGLKESITTVKKQSILIDDQIDEVAKLDEQIETLSDKLKACQETPEKPSEKPKEVEKREGVEDVVNDKVKAKPGVKTTEFYLTLIPYALIVLKQIFSIDLDQEILVNGILGIISMVTTGFYIWSRVQLKLSSN